MGDGNAKLCNAPVCHEINAARESLAVERGKIQRLWLKENQERLSATF